MTVYTSPLPDVELPESMITPYVLRHAAAMPDKPALIDGPSGRTITYGQLAGGIASVAGGLVERGFVKGECLAILSPNIPEYALAFHGTAMAGGIVTTINPTYTAQEVTHQLLDSSAKYIVTIPMFLEVAQAAIAGTSVEEIFVFGEAEGASPFSALMGAPLEEHVPCDLDDVVVLPYSSGTTGLSKGVMLTHRNLVSNLAQADGMLQLDDDDIGIAVLPFFHIYGMQVLMNGAVSHGTTLVTMPRFDLEQFLQICQDFHVTRYYLVPPIVLALAKHPLVDEYDLSAARQVFSGAAPLGAEVAAEAAQRIGCEVVQGYGLTETSPITHATLPGDYRPGSIGVLAPNMQCRIVDPVSGEDMAEGGDGEVWVRGPNVMKGYLNNAEATAFTIDEDGYLHTGDIGHIDEHGHYYIVDRLKELIKYKGFQVAPAELEALLLTHEAVADVAVIPVPDEEAGELPKAFVVLKPGAEATKEELQEFVAGQVASFKKIRELDFVEAIPKSASGKILRRILKEEERAKRRA